MKRVIGVSFQRFKDIQVADLNERLAEVRHRWPVKSCSRDTPHAFTR